MTGLAIGEMGLDELLAREWIAVNHLGGYASSTIASLNTRKYHGLLVAAMAPPVRRMVLLSCVHETVVVDEKNRFEISAAEYPDTISPRGDQFLRAFSNDPVPRWAYQGDGWTLDKELRMLRGTNTVCITYTLLGGSNALTLELRPLFALRGMHELTFQWNGKLDAIEHSTGDKSIQMQRIPATSRTPEVFFAHEGAFEADAHWYLNQIYRRERERGYAGLEDLWNPGVVRYELRAGQQVHFVCSTEPIDLKDVLSKLDRPTRSRETMSGEDETLATLVRAAEQFVVDLPADKNAPKPPNANTAPNATIPPQVAVIGNYPWSPPSIRDAVIAFSGLFLVTRRFDRAKSFLNSIAKKIEAGIVPTELAEDRSLPSFRGADTSLWFIHAVQEFLRYTDDSRAMKDGLFDACAKIVERYRAGIPSLGITCDKNGLLSSHVPNAATSWMDAKIGDWVVTPRQGKPVELNALWYNALRIVSRWCDENDQRRRASELSSLADRMKLEFNRVFWNTHADCCFDVVMDSGADASIRPNQLLAISLPNAVLASDRHANVLDVVERLLLTPVGLRTLSPEDPSYQPRYGGDVVSRDRAYHQGTVYPWLLGPFVTALLRVRGRSSESRASALDCLRGCSNYLQTDGLGQIAELFDAEAPHQPGGAIGSVRSAGEILRAYCEDVLNQTPETIGPSGKIEIPKPPVHR